MSNQITVSGKVGQDPELRYTPGGMAILTFSIADTYGKDEKRTTTWHDIKVFDKLAENTANTIAKGSTVIVVGRVEQREFTKKDGTKGKAVELIASEVGASCRWNAWVADQTDKVMAQVGQVFPGTRQIAEDEDPF